MPTPEEQAEVERLLEEMMAEPLIQQGQAVFQNRHALPDALREDLEEALDLDKYEMLDHLPGEEEAKGSDLDLERDYQPNL